MTNCCGVRGIKHFIALQLVHLLCGKSSCFITPDCHWLFSILNTTKCLIRDALERNWTELWLVERSFDPFIIFLRICFLELILTSSLLDLSLSFFFGLSTRDLYDGCMFQHTYTMTQELPPCPHGLHNSPRLALWAPTGRLANRCLLTNCSRGQKRR